MAVFHKCCIYFRVPEGIAHYFLTAICSQMIHIDFCQIDAFCFWSFQNTHISCTWCIPQPSNAVKYGGMSIAVRLPRRIITGNNRQHIFMQKGPQYTKGKDEARIRELWEIQYHSQIEPTLVDWSVYGDSIESICLAHFQEQLTKMQLANEAGSFLLDLFTTGFSAQIGICFSVLLPLIQNDTDFLSQCRFLAYAEKVLTLQRTILGNQSDALRRLVQRAFFLATALLPYAGGEAADISQGIRQLYALSQKYPTLCEKDAFLQQLAHMLADSLPDAQIYGVCLAIGTKTEVLSLADCQTRIAAFFSSANGELLAQFLTGFLSAGRDLLFVHTDILVDLDRAISQMESEQFLTVLPQLRSAFTALLPAETDRISHTIAQLHCAHPNTLFGSLHFSAEEIIRARSADQQAKEVLDTWRLSLCPPTPGKHSPDGG